MYFTKLEVKFCTQQRFYELTGHWCLFFKTFYYLEDHLLNAWQKKSCLWYGSHISVCLSWCWLFSFVLRAALCKWNLGWSQLRRNNLALKSPSLLWTTLIKFLAKSYVYSSRNELLASDILWRQREALRHIKTYTA